MTTAETLPKPALTTPPLPSQAGFTEQWANLPDSAAALAAVTAASNHDGISIIVTPDTASANRWLRSIDFFRPSDLPVLSFPDWETLPYDGFSPHQDIISERLASLQNLPQCRRGLLVVPMATLLQRLAPRSFVDGHSISLAVGQQFDPHAQRRRFDAAGYQAVDTVANRGEYAIRGSLMDIFPMGSDLPIRIDLFDDEIESLRTFDTQSQRTADQRDAFAMLPAKEFPLDDAAIAQFREAWHHTFNVDVRRCSIYQDVSQGYAPSGIEYYLPFFFAELGSLFDYLPSNANVFWVPELVGTAEECAQRCLADIQARYDDLAHDIERPILPPESLWLRIDELFGHLKQLPQVNLWPGAPAESKKASVDFFGQRLPSLQVNHRAKDPAAPLTAFLSASQTPSLLIAESAGRLQVLDEFLRRAKQSLPEVAGFAQFADEFLVEPQANNTPSAAICIGALDHGVSLPGFNLITEFDLFGERPGQRSDAERVRGARAIDPEQVIRNLTELRAGSPVVHLDHGVGRYLGLQTLNIDGADNEFLALEYADEAKLYVPVTSLHLIGRYSGADDAIAPLHRLGSDQWEKAKRKAAERAHDTAAELLNIYARRELKPAYQFTQPGEDYQRFADQFAFDMTPDQQRAIDEVIADLVADKTTDRLICGDVGFGKTEVAMRAAFVAVNSGKQVAVLVPTTLLAGQHGESFKDRFANWPVRVEVISRMRGDSEIADIAKALRNGSVDILIGTHKLLNPAINFKDLGLVVIDEEHRFGVRQKERLKALRSEVDVITLTATPIPRTLNLALSGLRELSIIATPPAKRMSIKTFVQEKRKHVIKEAINRELQRGGQVFYLHNEVQNIQNTADELAELVPEARIGIGHGQMPKRELERVMSEFYHRQVNLLVCTTIVENGIDVPNANTIIIERADKFGLAQLHQLRGRVGRSTRQAYAYLLTPHPKAISPDAVKRLEAIEASGELGVGFTLATHDLEIRGAGDLLGDGQSGQIEAVGFSLYMDLLERAVQAIKAGKTPDLDNPLEPSSQEVNLHAAVIIAENYLPDVHTRLILYKRIASAKTLDALNELKVEIVDRFGRAPEGLLRLFAVTELKLQADALGISKIDLGDRGGRIEFSKQVTIDPLRIVNLVQSQPQTYRLDGATVLRVQQAMESFTDRQQFAQDLLAHLAQD